MELKPGYKQTEIGVIPEDWRVRQLGDVCSVLRGGSPRPIENYITDKEDGINWIKIGDVGAGVKYIDTTSEKILPSGVSRSRYVKRGDFLLSNSMSFGRPYILRTEGCIHDGWLVIGEYQDSFDTDYLYYCLSSNAVLSQYARYAAGSSVLNLNKDIVSKVHVAIPEPNEQSRISEVLSALDELIDQLAGLVTKKRNMKQAAMQELLTGKRRLPGFAGEWRTVAISQVAEKITGFWGRSEPGSEAMHSTSVIRAGDISEDGRLIGAARRYLSHHESSLAGCRPGDTVMTASGNGLGKSWTCDQDGVYSASNFVRIIRPQRGKADGYFVGYALKSRPARSKLVEHTATSAYPNLKPSFFHDSWLSLPPEPEQKAISEILRDIDVEILELEARKIKASQLKQGMMQQLLTGRIRLR
jgi:type I restriction enzyme S subunit